MEAMADNVLNNITGEVLCRTLKNNPSFLDRNKIVWKIVNGEWIGKRSVWTFDFRACWLEDTTEDNVKSWWCGSDSDYKETFKRWN